SARSPRCSFSRRRAALFFPAPEMERVGENHIAKHFMWTVVGYVNRGIHLKIARDVPGKTARGGITRAALEIDLHPPGLIKIVGVTENRFVAEIDMRSADDKFVMLGVIACFDEGLRIDITVR